MKFSKSQSGFTILELLFAIAIWTVGFLAISNLLQITFFSARSARHHLVASHLAQEGVEIVHNIRDGCFLASSTLWGITETDCFDNSEGCEVDFVNGVNNQSGDDPFLKYNATSHTYGYFPSGPNIQDSVYKRDIYLTKGEDLGAGQGQPCDASSSACLKVESVVTWRQKGKEQSVDVESYLFNWD